MHRKIPLPRGWKRRVRSSVLHILAHADFQPARFDDPCAVLQASRIVGSLHRRHESALAGMSRPVEPVILPALSRVLWGLRCLTHMWNASFPVHVEPLVARGSKDCPQR